MNYLDIIKEVADSKLEYINRLGYAKPGMNGPYQNQDTPVRNSGHWLVIYGYLFKVTGNGEYKKAAERLVEYLLKPKNYGSSGSIIHRTDVRFDHTNGVIGQAWTIEALISAARLFSRSEYYEKAKKLWTIQKFDLDKGFWIVTDDDGSKEFDVTFNHQLWYAAAGSKILQFEEENGISESYEIGKQICSFLDSADEVYFKVYEDGLICHRLNYELEDADKEYMTQWAKKRKLRSLMHDPIGVITKKIKQGRTQFAFTEGLERGYHIFDLYGFALLKGQYGWHRIFNSEMLRMAVRYAFETNAMLDLEEECGEEPFNKFAFGYNSPAFEYPYVRAVLGSEMGEDISEALWIYQMDTTYDPSKKSFCRHCGDPETLDARLYELVPYLEMRGTFG